jgi:hypothetical protein
MEMMPDYVKYQKLDIVIIGNNSLSIKIQDTDLPATTNGEKSNKNQLTASDIGITID